MSNFEIGQLVVSLAVLSAFAAPTIFRWLKQRRALKRRGKYIEEKLAGRNPKELIAASSFGYGHWQGEDGYRIWDDRREPPFVGFGDSAESCDYQILELILAEEQPLANPP